MTFTTSGYGIRSKARTKSSSISFTLLSEMTLRKYLNTIYIPDNIVFLFPKLPNGPLPMASSKCKS